MLYKDEKLVKIIRPGDENEEAVVTADSKNKFNIVLTVQDKTHEV